MWSSRKVKILILPCIKIDSVLVVSHTQTQNTTSFYENTHRLSLDSLICFRRKPESGLCRHAARGDTDEVWNPNPNPVHNMCGEVCGFYLPLTATWLHTFLLSRHQAEF